MGRIAAATPVIWIGDRSYSIYLWHWPILVYGSHVFGHNGVTMAALVGLTLMVSAVAYHWIETPMRIEHGGSLNPKRPLRWLAVPGLGIALAGLALYLVPTLRGGTEAKVAERLIAAKSDFPNFTRPDCPGAWRQDPNNTCRFGNKSAAGPQVMLIGDSYAEHLFPGLDEAAARADWSLVLLLRSACPPLVEAFVLDPQKGVINTDCRRWLDAILERIDRDKPDLVLISTAGLISAPLADKSGDPINKSAALPLWQLGFTGFLERVKRSATSTVVIPGTPRGRFEDYDTCVSDTGGNHCGLPRMTALNRSAVVEVSARKVNGIEVFDLANRFCGPNVCYSVINGMIVYRDAGHHLTATFARTLDEPFQNVLRRISARSWHGQN